MAAPIRSGIIQQGEGSPFDAEKNRSSAAGVPPGGRRSPCPLLSRPCAARFPCPGPFRIRGRISPCPGSRLAFPDSALSGASPLSQRRHPPGGGRGDLILRRGQPACSLFLLRPDRAVPPRHF